MENHKIVEMSKGLFGGGGGAIKKICMVFLTPKKTQY